MHVVSIPYACTSRVSWTCWINCPCSIWSIWHREQVWSSKARHICRANQFCSVEPRGLVSNAQYNWLVYNPQYNWYNISSCFQSCPHSRSTNATSQCAPGPRDPSGLRPPWTAGVWVWSEWRVLHILQAAKPAVRGIDVAWNDGNFHMLALPRSSFSSLGLKVIP